MMSVQVVKFNRQDQPEFFKTLKKRVNNYFKEKEISRNANTNMKIKTAFMVLLYFVPMFMMISGTVTSFWPVMGMWILMSFGMSGIGLAVMHDANHGSYSKNKNVNKTLGFLLNFVGGFPINWKIQHNVLHHSFTNVDGFDEDIEKSDIMRFSPNQKRKKFFRFQAFYAPFFYGLMTIYWLLSKDFGQLARYRDMNLLKSQGTTFKKAMTNLIINKIWYIGLTFVLPLLMVGWFPTVIGFLSMHFISGLILSFIFQSAHVIQETDFYETNEDQSVENNWAIHQMKTTANFANNSKVFTWLIGGLNYQIEHHLFPNICHVHYPKISKIVRETAEEYGIPYYEHRTFFGALKSHFSLLHHLGTGKALPS